MSSEYDRPGLDDPLWEHVLQQRLMPYIPAVDAWWANIPDLSVHHTGIYGIEGAPPGLMYRFTRSPVKSPIKGIQAFPFVQTGYLQITGIQGGSTKMVERVCRQGLIINEYKIIEKHNLPSTINQGQFVAFVPITMYENTKELGSWLYFTQDEMVKLLKGEISDAMRNKILLRV